MLGGQTAGFRCPALQADATLSQASPTSGTYYTILDTTKNVRLESIAVNCTWTVQPDPLNLRVTLDGNVFVYAQANPVSTQNYNPVLITLLAPAGPHPMVATAGNGNEMLYMFAMLMRDFRIVKVEAAVTGGTVSNLTGRVRFSKW